MALRKKSTQQTAKTPAKKWQYKADLIAACICDWGCPCNFNSPPTNGYCDGVYAANIKKGNSGNVNLTGLKWVYAGSWPGAIHEGGGTGKVWIDEKATKEQRIELEKILKGELGGMPWTIFAATLDNWLETSIVPFEWKFSGASSSYNAGNQVRATLQPMSNPVTGDESHAKILLPKGLVCNELEATATKTFSVFTKGMHFAAPGKYGFYTSVEHSN